MDSQASGNQSLQSQENLDFDWYCNCMPLDQHDADRISHVIVQLINTNNFI